MPPDFATDCADIGFLELTFSGLSASE